MKTSLVASVAVLLVGVALVWANPPASANGTTTGNSTTGNSTTGNSTVGNSTTGNSTVGNSTTGNSSIIPSVAESAICSDTDLARGEFCSAKGVADPVCVAAAQKVNGTDPDCWDVGVCCITLGGSTGNASAGNATAGNATAAGNTTTTPKPTTNTTAAGNGTGSSSGTKILITVPNQVANFSMVKNCSAKVHIWVPAH